MRSEAFLLNIGDADRSGKVIFNEFWNYFPVQLCGGKGSAVTLIWCSSWSNFFC